MNLSEFSVDVNGHTLTRDERDVQAFVTEEGKAYLLEYDYFSCARCGEFPDLEVVGNSVWVATPCRFSGDVITVITIDVPSGKMVISDDLRPAYPWNPGDEGLHSFNTVRGQAQMTGRMASQGCAFGYVGNTDPDLYRTSRDTYIIARPCYAEDEEGNDSVIHPEGDLIAGVRTSQWTYAIADFESWKSRGGVIETGGSDVTVVDVTPGTYQFTHYTGKRGFQIHADATTVFADVCRVR